LNKGSFKDLTVLKEGKKVLIKAGRKLKDKKIIERNI